MFERWRIRKKPKIVFVSRTLLKVIFTRTCFVSQETMADGEVCLYRSQSIELSDCSVKDVDQAISSVVADYERAGIRSVIVD
jgi:hypothetical protein